MKKKWYLYVNCIFFLLVPSLFNCANDEASLPNAGNSKVQTLDRTIRPSLMGKKVFVLNSYHKGYAWSDDIEAGISAIFKAYPGIELKFFRMDSKRTSSEEFIKNAAAGAKRSIEQWGPDVVIASDDDASKYLVVPYYKNADLPFVFCGVNWDAAPYGYPFKNVTGMVEVALMDDLVRTLKKNGNRVGFLGPNSTSTRQDRKHYRGIVGIDFAEEKFVDNFSEWKSAYRRLQNSLDVLILPAWQGIRGWDEQEAIDFILKNTRIPSGAEVPFMAKYVLATFAKDPMEQGEWAANAALQILNGKSPEEIPITTNKKARIILNMKLAKKIGFKFPLELIERATFVEEGGF